MWFVVDLNGIAQDQVFMWLTSLSFPFFFQQTPTQLIYHCLMNDLFSMCGLTASAQVYSFSNLGNT